MGSSTSETSGASTTNTGLKSKTPKTNTMSRCRQRNGRLSLTKFNQIQEELRRVEWLNHNNKVKALEKKNMELEMMHGKMMDRVVDSHNNQLRYQKFEMGEQERKFQQEMELKETEVKELKELRDIGIKTAEMVNIEHNAMVHKLKKDNKREMERKEMPVAELREHLGVGMAGQAKELEDGEVRD